PLQQCARHRRNWWQPAESWARNLLSLLRSTLRRSLPAAREHCSPGWLRDELRAFPEQPVRIQLPGTAEQWLLGTERLCAGGASEWPDSADGEWIPCSNAGCDSIKWLGSAEEHGRLQRHRQEIPAAVCLVMECVDTACAAVELGA